MADEIIKEIKNEEEANKIIQDFKDFDKGNDYDSYAYGDVSESDLVEGLSSTREGIISGFVKAAS